MNEVCFPIGLSIQQDIIVNRLCVKKNFDYHMEKRILNKIYSCETKSNSRKDKVTKIKTRKHY
jgi:hypothetical protein